MWSRVTYGGEEEDAEDVDTLADVSVVGFTVGTGIACSNNLRTNSPRDNACFGVRTERFRTLVNATIIPVRVL